MGLIHALLFLCFKILSQLSQDVQNATIQLASKYYTADVFMKVQNVDVFLAEENHALGECEGVILIIQADTKVGNFHCRAYEIHHH